MEIRWPCRAPEVVDLAADNDAPAGGIFGGGFGGVARQIQDGLAQQGIVARHVGKFSHGRNRNARARPPPTSATTRSIMGRRATCSSASCRGRANFRNSVTTWVSARVWRRMNSPCSRNSVPGCGFAANHLRVAGNRRQGVLEFVRDAGGKLSERGQIFLHVNLFLQRGEFGQVAEQANRAGDFVACCSGSGKSSRRAGAIHATGSGIPLLRGGTFARVRGIRRGVRVRRDPAPSTSL